MVGNAGKILCFIWRQTNNILIMLLETLPEGGTLVPVIYVNRYLARRERIINKVSCFVDVEASCIDR